MLVTRGLQTKAEDANARLLADLANARRANEQMQEHVRKNNEELRRGTRTRSFGRRCGTVLPPLLRLCCLHYCDCVGAVTVL